MTKQMQETLGHDSELALGEMNGSLALSFGHFGGFIEGQTATDGTGLLGTHIQGQVLALGIQFTEFLTLVAVEDR